MLIPSTAVAHQTVSFAFDCNIRIVTIVGVVQACTVSYLVYRVEIVASPGTIILIYGFNILLSYVQQRLRKVIS